MLLRIEAPGSGSPRGRLSAGYFTLHLPLTQVQVLRSFPDCNLPGHRVLDYLDSLHLLSAQCHSLLSAGGDRFPEQLHTENNSLTL